jgi:hypothetical protein
MVAMRVSAICVGCVLCVPLPPPGAGEGCPEWTVASRPWRRCFPAAALLFDVSVPVPVRRFAASDRVVGRDCISPRRRRYPS